MEKFTKHIKLFKELYSVIIIVLSFFGTTTLGYTEIVKTVNQNTKTLENTQITMLKSIVREFEKNHNCKISDAEWDEYLLNYSTLFDLKVSHKMLSDKASWLPVQRKTFKCKDEL